MQDESMCGSGKVGLFLQQCADSLTESNFHVNALRTDADHATLKCGSIDISNHAARDALNVNYRPLLEAISEKNDISSAPNANSDESCLRISAIHIEIAKSRAVGVEDALAKVMLLNEFICEAGANSLEAELSRTLLEALSRLSGYSGL